MHVARADDTLKAVCLLKLNFVDDAEGFIDAGGHANVPTAAHNPGFQTAIFSGSPGYALNPSAQVPEGALEIGGLKIGSMGGLRPRE